MKCRICGNNEDNQEYRVREMMYGYRDIFLYYQCSKCGCLQIAEIPANMSKYYPDGYYSYEQIQKLNRAVLNRVVKYLARLRDRYALFKRGIAGKILFALFPSTPFDFLTIIHPTPQLAILEVGCGSGNLLYALYEVGFMNVLGVDPFIENDIDYENGLRIRKLNIHEAKVKWDIIMFHHSFEHVPDPRETLQRAFQLLNPGGHCIILIPTVSSYAWKHYGVNWVQLDAPRHFFLHSRESIEILCKETGFELFTVVYNSTAMQLWGSEQYIRDIPLHDERSYVKTQLSPIFSKEELSDFVKRAEKLNADHEGDQAMFYLKKL